jgi:hypothetical protein
LHLLLMVAHAGPHISIVGHTLLAMQMTSMLPLLLLLLLLLLAYTQGLFRGWHGVEGGWAAQHGICHPQPLPGHGRCT